MCLFCCAEQLKNRISVRIASTRPIGSTTLEKQTKTVAGRLTSLKQILHEYFFTLKLLTEMLSILKLINKSISKV